MKSLLVSLFTLCLISTPVFAMPPAPKVTIDDATEVLEDMSKLKHKGIPTKLLQDAKAVAIIPRVIKGGFLIGGRIGHGIVIVKDDQGVWLSPTFVTLGGASFGFQAGVQSSDVVLVFKNKDTLARLLDGKKKFTLGGDASVAAGPLGRDSSAATDGKLEAEIYSYSRARGLFAGVSLSGGMLNPNKDINEMFAADQRPETQKAYQTLIGKLQSMMIDAPPETVKP